MSSPDATAPSGSRRFSILFLAVLFLAVACSLATACGDTETTSAGASDGSGGGSGTASVDLAELAVGSWTLQSGRGTDGPVPMLASHPITLVVEAEAGATTASIGGTAACNGYGGSVTLGRAVDSAGEDTVGSTEFRLGEMSVTEMGCDPFEAMQSEAAYLRALSTVERLSLDPDRLTLSGPDTELVFAAEAPVPAADLIGQTWLLDTLIEGDAASTVRGDEALLVLNADGTLTGGTGCRMLRGEYQLFGSEVQFTSFSAEGDCTDDLAAQDNLVVTVLGDGFTAEIDGQRLTVSSGPEGLSYKALDN